MNILGRLEKETGQKPSQIMRKLGISKAYYSMIKNDKSSVSKNLAIKIHQEYSIPLEEILIRITVNDTLTNAI